MADGDQKIKSDYDLVLTALNGDLFKVGRDIKSFIHNNLDSNALFRLIVDANNDYREKTMASQLEDHQDWFKSATDSKCSTKEEVMRRKSQDRIRGYYYKVKDEIVGCELYKTNFKAKAIMCDILDYFKYLLIAADHFSCLFDRSHPDRHTVVDTDDTDAAKQITKRRKLEIIEMVNNDPYVDVAQLKRSLCNARGDFLCFGQWFKDECQYDRSHVINPYTSRENMILFQTWNLDHQVELTRTVIPSLLVKVESIVNGKAICQRHKTRATMVSVFTYFKEFFTIENLRLVHIICHDKGRHDLQSKGTVICSKCKEYKFLLRLRETCLE